MTTFEAYLLVMLGNVKILLGVVISLLIFFIIASIISDAETEEDKYEGFRNTLTLLLIIFSLAATFIPSTKQAATIILLPAIVNNEKIQTTVGNGLDLMELTTEWLKDQMSDKVKEAKQ